MTKQRKAWFAIYVIFNIITNESYVGITRAKNKKFREAIQRRLQFHFKAKSDTLIVQNIQKYGKENFQIYLAHQIQGEREALDIEKELIKSGRHVLNMEHRISKRISKRSLFDRFGFSETEQPDHPGNILKNLLLNINDESRLVFPDLLKLSNTEFQDLLEGRLDLSIQNCIFLSKIFGTKIDFWIKAQRDYDIYCELNKLDIEKYNELPRFDLKKKD